MTLKTHKKQSTVEQASSKREAKRVRRSLRPFIIPIVMMLIGLGVLLYPVVATQWNNYRGNMIARSYQQQIYSLTPEQRKEVVDRARQYNATHKDGAKRDPWGGAPDPRGPEYQEYLHQLDTVDAMAQLIIPKIHVDLPVYHGTDAETLDHGIGHLYGSSLPVGGPDTHSVLTGHTGFANATLLDNLVHLRYGDDFYINTVDGPLKYVVDQIKIVLPSETDDLKIIPGGDYVTLVTCTPYGINSHRLLVRGHRVPFVPHSDAPAIKQATAITWQWWMIAIIAFVAAVLLALVISLIVYLRNSRKTRPAALVPKETPTHD